MAYNFGPFKQNIKGMEDWLKREFSSIRTGRATPAILDGLKADAYGSPMPLNQLANIAIEDARTLRLTPWDISQMKVIEKSIIISDLGLSVSVDEKGMRIIFPELTSDRREALIKIAKQKLEEARITIRNEREKVVRDIENQEKSGKISEDERFRLKTELQKMVDDSAEELGKMLIKKEKEISE